MRDTKRWTPPPVDGDTIEWLVGHALLAPSSHNTQPWIVEPRGPYSFDLYVDRERLLPQVDPHARQTHISQGCFLEGAALAGRHRGLSVDIDYFPQGSYGERELDDRPVARLTAEPGGAEPTPFEERLFEAIPDRQSNKRTFRRHKELSDEQKERLHDAAVVCHDPLAVRLALIDEPVKLRQLTYICRDAMKVEVASRDRNAELAEWFRFSRGELLERRDGFGISQSGTTGMTRWFVEKFLLDRREAADPHGDFARQGVQMCEAQASSAPSFAALLTAGNSRTDQLIAGRTFMRLQLLATSLGIATHPISQALQEYEEMSEQKQRMEATVGTMPEETLQMFVRLGFARAVPHSPRRPVDAIVRPAAAATG